MKYKIPLIIIIISTLFLLGCTNITKNVPTNVSDESITDSFSGNIILGRPTKNSITASITTKTDANIYLAYGEKPNNNNLKTEIKNCSSTTPAVFIMNNLSLNKTYYYSVYYKYKDDKEYSKSGEYSFSTPKESGNEFNFTVQSDSHLLNKADPELYKVSMENMLSTTPDFMFDLGDTFLMDNGGNKTQDLTQEKVNEIYRQQLPYFTTVTKTAPLFLTIGNHESEYGTLLDGTKDNLAAKSTIARTTYYPNPVPNDFYSGNTQTENLFGLVQNYYAFTWGDALFVSIDPYRYSQNGASDDNKGDGWGWSLGKTQYDWFCKTLENSDAKYKFVFSHHAIGNIRGGAKIAKLYEWGGYDQKGNYLFDTKRPGWGKPIQQVMKDNGVDIFFQGHDHLFARENVDGVIYQTIPKPAEMIADKQNNFISYTEDILMNSGFLNVKVAKDNVTVEYNRNYLVASGEQTTGVVYSYSIDENNQIKIIKDTEDTLANYGKNEVTTNKASTSSATSSKQKNKGNKGKVDYVLDPVASSLTPVPTNGFSFAVEADPHFDNNSDSNVLATTVKNIISAKPSFLIDLGDTSMLEKLGKTAQDLQNRNNIVEQYFSNFNNIPIKMVTGNHDEPINTQKGNYYSFAKNNALFIVLDPYAFSTMSVGKGGGWATTLGKTQYDWLKNTLANSSADFKFVFIHNLTGAISKDSRGGIEATPYFEWGGKNENGVDEFSKMRPQFDMPIHNLLVKYDVDAVFHGHDHFYANQEKDGILYQLVPQPGALGSSINSASEYGYKSGTLLPASGYLRVVVSDSTTTVEYIRSELDGSNKIVDLYNIDKQ